METHLHHVRESGAALEIGEFQDGLTCLACPVRSPAGAVLASVAVSLAPPDLAGRRWAVERALRHGATIVTRALHTALRDQDDLREQHLRDRSPLPYPVT